MAFTEEQTEASSCKARLKAAAEMDNVSLGLFNVLCSKGILNANKGKGKIEYNEHISYFRKHIQKIHRWALTRVLFHLHDTAHWSTDPHPET